jgi:hypothetical protein
MPPTATTPRSTRRSVSVKNNSVPSGLTTLLFSVLTMAAHTPRGATALGCPYSAAHLSHEAYDLLLLEDRGVHADVAAAVAARGIGGDGGVDNDGNDGTSSSRSGGFDTMEKKRKLLQDPTSASSSSSTPTAAAAEGDSSCRLQPGTAGGGHLARDAPGWSAACPDADSPYATPLR